MPTHISSYKKGNKFANKKWLVFERPEKLEEVEFI